MHDGFRKCSTHPSPRRHTFASSRLTSPELCLDASPPMKEGAGKAGSRLAPIDRYAMSSLRYNAQRVTGQPEHPGLPCAMVGTAYVVLSPGSDALLPPSPCGWLTCVPGRATHITARLGAQTPGARTTRFGRTPITSVVGARSLLTVARPARPFAPMWPASTAARPAFVTIAIRPSSLGRSERTIRQFRISVK
ncbi:hypothetical protein M2232_002824 [Bradyrhizobium japonicum]|nr:hypothetical protein [Bradyrhizobium japonicum]MCW2343906.1 hypothetical protein [Bradyrhizobium japonicum]